jgi:hypothetical protein
MTDSSDDSYDARRVDHFHADKESKFEILAVKRSILTFVVYFGKANRFFNFVKATSIC